ncbi:MAG: hypothetical protein MK060_01710 [Blastomonas sp.]|nr:hypothetical protein [Blastomonas sp.]
MRCIDRLLALALTLYPSLAVASGFQAFPETRERLASKQACLEFLRKAASNDARAPRPKTIGADGTRQTITLEAISKGVERLGRNRARYAAKIWTVNGWPRPDLGQIEYRANWEEHAYECRGRMLTSRLAQGFTSESFEPLP